MKAAEVGDYSLDIGEQTLARTPAHSGQWKELMLPRIGHELGDLCFGESRRHIPFEIARFFFIFDIPSHAKRGSHAHRSVSQAIFAVKGAFTINLDNCGNRETVRLTTPERGLLVGPMVWKGIEDYEANSICLVMASGNYDEHEYIRSHSDWLSEIRSNGSHAT